MAKIHKFYLNFCLFSSILIGFLIASFFEVSNFDAIFWLILFAILVFFAFRISRRICFVGVILAGILLSFWRFSNFRIQIRSIERFYGAQVEAAGRIIEDPDFNKENGETSVKILMYKIKFSKDSNFTKHKGKIYVKFKTSKEIRRSDEIIVSGRINKGFGGFSASMYRAKILSIRQNTEFVRDIRDEFSQGVSKFIQSPARELGLGFLLGQKNSLPADLEKALRITALTHIVVASGYNLTILVNFSRKFFGRVSKKAGLLLSSVLVFGFVLVVGFSPSMTRAGIVAFIGLILGYFGRKINPYFLLSFVASITLLIDPANIYDLGWQLSFGSFFGVLILAPLLKNFLFENPEKLNALASLFFETLSAQIMTFPLIILAFGAFSNISIISNMIVLPLIPIAMIFTFLAGVFAQILPLIAGIFAFLAENILNLIIEIVKFFASQNFAQSEISISAWQAMMFYVLLIFVVTYLQIKKFKHSKT